MTPELSKNVAEPFRSDPDFWRSVCASADAVLLLAVAVACSVALRLTGAPTVVVLLPFVLPVAFLVRAAIIGSRFHRGQEPMPAVVETTRGEQSWRDAERLAVGSVFGRALVRRRLHAG